jgi:hypothetical protein
MRFKKLHLAALALVLGACGIFQMLGTLASWADLYWLSLIFALLSIPLQGLSYATSYLLISFGAGGAFNEVMIFANFMTSFFLAPSLFLWGLINIQTSQVARQRVILWSFVTCAVTVPFGFGLALCFPLFLVVMLPLVRRFKNQNGLQ